MQRNSLIELMSMIAGFFGGIVISYIFGWGLLFGMLVTVSLGVFGDWLYGRKARGREARSRRN
ncbi:Uncharacterised protein [Pannonibacter phragmitetus]|uniref:DUF2273 domain-containing protein n=1 Tax=Pannonibacter phragmitetus TaxID=121719 RepID=A0A378ZUH3_9HYPH|nr:hypothetical protein [Pannonibacter phragmitetus]SUB00440.1 Uncharacterised protein [Pannonibacter phragmitetus]